MSVIHYDIMLVHSLLYILSMLMLTLIGNSGQLKFTCINKVV